MSHSDSSDKTYEELTSSISTDLLTPTSTCETSMHTSVTEPPIYNWELDATLNPVESLHKEVSKTLFLLNTIGLAISWVVISLLYVSSFVNKTNLNIAVPPILALSLISLSLMRERKRL